MTGRNPTASRGARRGGLSGAMLLLLTLAMLTGCPPHEDGLIVDPRPLPRPEVMPTYADLAAAQNARVATLDRVWARAKLELRWVDDDGDKRRERGEARLLLKLDEPGLGLPMGSAFGDMMWAGYDAERFWLFDLENDHAWVGQTGGGRVLLLSGLPLPLDPTLTPMLLGLAPLDRAETTEVRWDNGMFLIHLRRRGMRMWFGREKLLPRRVELIGPDGQLLVRCALSDYTPFRSSRVVSDNRPQVLVPATVGVAVPSRDAGITLELSGFSESKRKFKDRAFEFESLVEVHEPKTVENLDE